MFHTIIPIIKFWSQIFRQGSLPLISLRFYYLPLLMSWFLFRISPHIYFQVFVFNTWMLFLLLFFFSEQRSRIVTIFEYWSNISKSGKECSFMISWILSFLFVLTWDLLEVGHIDDIATISNKILLFLII